MRSSKPAGRQHQQQQPHRTTSSLSEQGLNSAAGNAKSHLPGKVPPSCCCCRCDLFVQSWSRLWESRLWSFLVDRALSIYARGTDLSCAKALCCMPGSCMQSQIWQPPSSHNSFVLLATRILVVEVCHRQCYCNAGHNVETVGVACCTCSAPTAVCSVTCFGGTNRVTSLQTAPGS